MQYNVSSPQTRFYIFLHYYRDSQLMFFSLGNYLTHNGYWVNERHDGWTWKDGRNVEIIWKTDKLVLIVGGF